MVSTNSEIHVSGPFGPEDASHAKLFKLVKNPGDFEDAKFLFDLKLKKANDIQTEFQLLNRICKTKKMVDNFQTLDIYCDVHPYQHSMIWLDGKIDQSDGYINCSRIKSCFHEDVGHIIAT
jgi:protein tyrosine phosphatase